MWPTTTLGDVTDTGQYGLNAAALKEGGGIRFIRITDIDSSGQLGGASPAYVDAKLPDLERFMLSAGDLLIARSGATAGKSLLFRGLPEPAVFAGYLIRFKARVDRVLPEYLGHFLQSPLYWGFIRKTARAVAQPNVNARELASLPVPLPPVAEQQRIVELLSRAENIVRMRREAEQRAKEIIPALFLDMFGDPATNPKGGAVDKIRHQRNSVVRLGDVAEVVSGVAKGRKLGGKVTRDVPYLRVANVQAGGLDLAEMKYIPATADEITELAVRAGDVLLTEGGDFDKVGRGALLEADIGECIHQNHVFRVRTHADRVMPEYFAAYLQTFPARQYFLKAAKKTSNLASINMTQLRNLPLPLPRLDTQREFQKRFRACRALEKQQSAATGIANVSFQSLLAGVFSEVRAT
jgi:type I restriction enzyme S subunit